MRYSLVTIIAAASVASAQSSVASWSPAPQVTSNPVGAHFVATLPEQKKNNVRGSVVAYSAEDGKGVRFAVSISGLPAEGGPFMYHLHEKPVPEDGNCTGTGAHLDPYKRGEVPICDASKPETCQTGDLSGKHGNFTKDDAVSYVDLFSATDPANVAYFGNLSVVVHLSNKTRISCANFKIISPGGAAHSGASSGYALPTGSATPNSTLPSGSGYPGHSTAIPTSIHSPTPTQPSEPPQQTTNAAEKLSIAGMGLLAGVLALAL